MIEAVFRHEGTLDKLMGDGLMAYFGAPIDQPDHALRAVACGLDIRDAVARLSNDRTSVGLPPLGIGVGIHTGEVVLGDIGCRTEARFYRGRRCSERCFAHRTPDPRTGMRTY